MARPTIAIIGASTNRRKYGNRALRSYLNQGFEVFPIHPTAREVEGIKTYPSIADVPVAQVNRVSFYVPPEVGLQLIEGVARKNPQEVWFNPGSESDELIEKARALGLNVIVACSIVAIGENPNAY